jgi:hypothetical protein
MKVFEEEKTENIEEDHPFVKFVLDFYKMTIGEPTMRRD